MLRRGLRPVLLHMRAEAMRGLWFLIFMLVSFGPTAQEAWTPVKSDSRVVVFTKLLPGKRYKSFKAVAVVRARPKEVRKILDDVASYVDWFAYCRSARVLETRGTDNYIYIETDLPWPYRNEDMIYQVSVNESERGEIQYQLTGRPSFLPGVKGVKRMEYSKGQLLLRPEKGYTEVTYVMHSELAGDIPAWLANINIHSMPMKTMRNLIELAELH